MARNFVGAAAGDLGSGGSYTGDSELAVGGRVYWSQESTGGARYIQQDGTYSQLSFYIVFNDLTTSTTIKTRKNGADSNISITVPANFSGTFYAPSETETVSVGDTFGVQTITGAGTGAFQSCWSAIFTTTGTAETMLHSAGPYATRGPSETSYFSPSWIGSLTETTIETQIQFSATLKRLTVLVLNNSISGSSSTFTSRKNTAAGNMSCSIPASTTGQFRDNSNTDSLSAGDKFAYRLSTGTGTGGEIIEFSADSQLMMDNGRNFLPHYSSASRAFGSVVYYPPVGTYDGAESDSEIFSHLCTAFSYKVSNAYLKVIANTSNGSSTYVSRIASDPNFKNDGNISITIPAGVTGYFSDISHFDTVKARQFYNFKLSVGGTSGTVQVVHKWVEVEVLTEDTPGVSLNAPQMRVRNE